MYFSVNYSAWNVAICFIAKVSNILEKQFNENVQLARRTSYIQVRDWLSFTTTFRITAQRLQVSSVHSADEKSTRVSLSFNISNFVHAVLSISLLFIILKEKAGKKIRLRSLIGLQLRSLLSRALFSQESSRELCFDDFPKNK